MNDDWPDWQDSGRTVQGETEKKEKITGILFVKDVFTNDGDEIPIFCLMDPCGNEHSFCDLKNWRFL